MICAPRIYYISNMDWEAVNMNYFRGFLIVFIALLLSISGSFGYLVYTIGEMEQLPEPSPPLTTRIYDCRDELMAVRYEENRVEVPLERVSEYLVNATLAVEDRRFYRHHGFDPAGLARALLSNLKGGQTSQGGSTITQQLAKICSCRMIAPWSENLKRLCTPFTWRAVIIKMKSWKCI